VVCDTDAEMTAKIEREFPSVETTDSVASIMEDDSIEAVVIALPAALHYEYGKMALQAGKHILMEKPLAVKSEEVTDLMRIAEENNKTIMVGHTFLYNTAVNKIKQYIDSGELGEIYYIFSQRLNLGKVRQDVNAMWNLAPHDISMILFWLNETPSQTTAKGMSYLQDGIEDLVFMHLDFPSGRSAHIHINWLSPRKTREMVIVGSKKMLLYDDTSSDAKITIFDKGIDKDLKNGFDHDIYDYATFNLSNRIGDIIIPSISFQEPLNVECRHFVDCILTGKTPITGSEDGLNVVKILENAQNCLDRERNFHENNRCR
jgi:predicted dehydrogenase